MTAHERIPERVLFEDAECKVIRKGDKIGLECKPCGKRVQPPKFPSVTDAEAFWERHRTFRSHLARVEDRETVGRLMAAVFGVEAA